MNEYVVDKKLIDCHYFLTHSCTKGDACEFRHFAPILNTTLVCTLWDEIKCTNFQCEKRHPSGPNLVRSCSKPCYYFQYGTCTKANCPFLHSTPSAKKSEQPPPQEQPKTASTLKLSIAPTNTPPTTKPSNQTLPTKTTVKSSQPESQSSSQTGFGVKSFEELMAEKKLAEASNAPQPATPSKKPTTNSPSPSGTPSPSVSQSNGNVEGKRKLEQSNSTSSDLTNTPKRPKTGTTQSSKSDTKAEKNTKTDASEGLTKVTAEKPLGDIVPTKTPIINPSNSNSSKSSASTSNTSQPLDDDLDKELEEVNIEEENIQIDDEEFA